MKKIHLEFAVRFKFIRNMDTLTIQSEQSIVAIGNFDGVHIGHQAVLNQLKQQAEQLHLSPWLIIFEPQPKEYFSHASTMPRLTSLREKIHLLNQSGITHIACIKFNNKLANLSATEFVQKILVNYLNVANVIVGEDFHFGKNRSGNIQVLRQLGEQFHFQVGMIQPIKDDLHRVSSTRIRQALIDHDLSLANRLIGRPYTICGKVIQGDKRGRQLGFPTANIRLGKRVLPLSGVYAVRVRGIGDHQLNGVANAGTRPTVDGQRRSLEVHLFDFDQEIYGKYIEIEFVQYVRSEMRFDSLQSLKEQIEIDVQHAKEILHLI